MKTVKKKIERDDLMERVAGARCFLNSGNRNEDLEMKAFMAIFHPEFKPGKKTKRKK